MHPPLPRTRIPHALHLSIAILVVHLAAGSAHGGAPELARPLMREARAIVALHSTHVRPVDPAERPNRMQDYEVSGVVAACLKGRLRPPSEVSYRLTAEAPPERLARDHVAFLKPARGGWVAVEGPMFDDTPALRRELRRDGAACR